MSLSLKIVDEKIASLKQKKRALETKQAQHLSKYLATEIGDLYSPQLAACVVQDTWQNAPTDQKETWLKAAKKFQFSKPQKAAKTASQNPASHQSHSKKKA